MLPMGTGSVLLGLGRPGPPAEGGGGKPNIYLTGEPRVGEKVGSCWPLEENVSA